MNGHVHAEACVSGPRIGAVNGNRLARIARDRDANEIAIADDAVGGIEFDPAGTWEVGTNPGMGRAATDIAVVFIAVNEKITAAKPRRDAEAAQRFDHE